MTEAEKKLTKIEEICGEFALECHEMEEKFCDEDEPYTGDWDEGRLAGMKNILNALGKVIKTDNTFSGHSKSEMRSMLEDVVTVLDLSEDMIEKHGPLGTEPAELVRLVLEQKDKEIAMLRAGMKPIE